MAAFVPHCLHCGPRWSLNRPVLGHAGATRGSASGIASHCRTRVLLRAPSLFEHRGMVDGLGLRSPRHGRGVQRAVLRRQVSSGFGEDGGIVFRSLSRIVRQARRGAICLQSCRSASHQKLGPNAWVQRRYATQSNKERLDSRYLLLAAETNDVFRPALPRAVVGHLKVCGRHRLGRRQRALVVVLDCGDRIGLKGVTRALVLVIGRCGFCRVAVAIGAARNWPARVSSPRGGTTSRFGRELREYDARLLALVKALNPRFELVRPRCSAGGALFLALLRLARLVAPPQRGASRSLPGASVSMHSSCSQRAQALLEQPIRVVSGL